MCKGSNLNTLKLKIEKLKIKQICGKEFGAQLCIQYNFVLVWSILIEK